MYALKSTPNNVLVGKQAGAVKPRTAFLDAAISKKITFERAPYNPGRAFRVAYNAYALDRQYDYAVYAYMDGDVNTENPVLLSERSYFVRGFRYVNDAECDLIVESDILADVWEDITFSRALQAAGTYSSTVLNQRRYKPKLPEGGLYKYYALQQWSVMPDENANRLCFLEVVYTQERQKYKESGAYYEVAIVLLPFFRTPTGEILTYKWTTNKGNVPSDLFRGIERFGDLKYYTEDGFKIQSTSIIEDTAFMVSSVEPVNAETWKINFRDSVVLGELDVDISSQGIHFYCMRVLIFNQFKNSQQTRDYDVILSITDTDIAPLTYITIFRNNQRIRLDPVVLKNNTRLRYVRSLLPPFTAGVYVVELVGTQYTPQFGWVWDNNEQFLYVSDTYSEWLQTNYNATITGLQTRQDTARENLRLQGTQAALQAATNLTTGLLSGRIDKAVGGIAGVGTTLSGYLISEAELRNNQTMENTLLDLRMKDIENTPDKVSFAASLDVGYIQHNNASIIKEESVFLDAVVKNQAAYGVEQLFDAMDGVTATPTAPALFKKHTYWDYIRLTAVEFSESAAPYLSMSEEAQLREILQNGVRVWYDPSHFLDFTSNPEVTE